MFDNGADFNILSYTLYSNFFTPPLLSPGASVGALEGATGTPLVVRGTVIVDLCIGSVIIPAVEFVVVDNLSMELASTPLLGIPFFREHMLDTNWVENYSTLRRAPTVHLPFLSILTPPSSLPPNILPPHPPFPTSLCLPRTLCVPARSSVFIRTVIPTPLLSFSSSFVENNSTTLFEPDVAALELLGLTSPQAW